MSTLIAAVKSLSILSFVLILFLNPIHSSKAQAQDVDRNLILASDLVNTTLNGAMLGSAIMGLQNSTNYKDPLRVGVGLGMLAGVGLATYDLLQVENGRDMVYGTFISGNNSSVVLLIDTIYGAVAGSVIGTAIILVSNEPLTDGLQYGASLGGWVGFGFGLVDTFILSRNRAMSPLGGSFDSDFAHAGGSSNVRIGFLQPDLTRIVSFDEGGMSSSLTGGQVIPKPVLNLIELNVRF